MKNLFSNAIIAAAIALAVPNNGAEAVGTVTGMVTRVAAVQPLSLPTVSVTDQATANVSSAQPAGTPDPTFAWLMALGFLGLVVARRVRGQ